MSAAFALAVAAALQAADAPPPSEAVQVEVQPGRHERCIVNPPLLLAAEGALRIKPGSDYDLTRLGPDGMPIDLIAFGPASAFRTDGAKDEVLTLAIDELSVRSGEVTSRTGQAWNLFEQAKAGPKSRLTPKTGDYSLCRFAEASASASRPNTRGFSVLKPDRSNQYAGMRRHGVQGMLSAGAKAILDIFGLNAGSFVRIRLSSDPSDAQIFLGGTLQPPRTDTVLDVIAAELPHLRLQKDGFQPCIFSSWTTTFEPRSNNRVLNASCKLVPLRPERSRQ